MAARKLYTIKPLDKGYEVNSQVNGKPQKSGHTTRKNAIQNIFNKIPANHLVIIEDGGEIN